METVFKKENDKLTVTLSGRVDTTTAPELETKIFAQLDGVSELILDLNNMPYTSSAGLRVFLKLHRAMKPQGTMKVVHVCDDVMEVFEMTGFSDILTIE